MTTGATDSKTRITVRRIVEADNDAIAAIWNHEVQWSDATFDTEPRTAAAQAEWFASHDDRYPAIVAVAAGEVVAYGTLSPYRSKPAYRMAVEDAVYVAAAHRGRGLGGLFVGHLVELARERSYHAVMARITGGNDASIRLHERHGFQTVGVEREIGFKFGKWRDVVVMERVLDDRDPPEAR